MFYKLLDLSMSERNTYLSDVNHYRTLLMIDAPFTMPMMKFKVHFVEFPQGYGLTNGFELFIDAKKWNELTGAEKEGFLYHEWMHIVNLHSKRLNRRDPRMWNFAADFVINDHIIHDNHSSQITLPKGTLYDYKYRGMFSEKVYEDLRNKVDEIKEKIKNDSYTFSPNSSKSPEQQQGDKQEFDEKNKYCGADRAAEILATQEIVDGLFSDDLAPAPENASNFEKDLIRDIIKAAELHKKMKGSLPGHYEEMINRMKKSQLPWKQIFHSFFKEVVSGFNDRTFARPKKWSWGYGIILPSEIGTRKLDVVLICDTSASMSNKDFEAFVGELYKILPLVKTLTLISADINVHEKVKIRNIKQIVGDKPIFKFKGRGGTSFVPALKEANKIKSDIVIYFTDGFGDFGTKPKNIKNMLWVLTNDECRKPPFGKYLIIN